VPDSAHQSLVLDGLGGLIAVLAAVALAPAVVALSRRPSWASRAVAAAIPGAVLSIVALHLIPSSLETAGLVIVVPVVLGFVAPMGADVLAHRTSVDMRAVSALAMLLLALTPHFLLDGLALVAHHSPQLDETHDSTLRAAAIALHTLPLSAMLWMTARTAGGIRVAAAAMFYTAAATSLGFLGGGLFLSGLGGHVSAIFNAFVAGTLIHVSSHSPRRGRGGARSPARDGRVVGAGVWRAAHAGRATLRRTLGRPRRQSRASARSYRFDRACTRPRGAESRVLIASTALISRSVCRR
jgi:hypothetical protein